MTSQSDWIPRSSTWTDEELVRIGSAEELRISSRRMNGSLRPFVTIWTVRYGDDIYVRSAHGPENGWFVRAVAAGERHIAPAPWSVTSPSSDLIRPSTPESMRPTTRSTTNTVGASWAPWSVPRQLARRCGSRRNEPEPRHGTDNA